MGWFTEITHEGKDLYPLLRARFEEPEYYVNEKVRGEAFRHFGYFMTESTGHLAEYLPYFRKSQEALDRYCDEPGFGGESGAYYNWCASVAERYNNQASSKQLWLWTAMFIKVTAPPPSRATMIQSQRFRCTVAKTFPSRKPKAISTSCCRPGPSMTFTYTA